MELDNDRNDEEDELRSGESEAEGEQEFEGGEETGDGEENITSFIVKDKT